jgi:polyphosphate kinase
MGKASRKHEKHISGSGDVRLNAKESVRKEAAWKLGPKPAKKDKGEDERDRTEKKYSYVDELVRLQFELIKLQDWVQKEGLKVVVIFEGRDAAGKGGVIKRITESLNPRVCRVVALGTPTERERGQWYFQR